MKSYLRSLLLFAGMFCMVSCNGSSELVEVEMPAAGTGFRNFPTVPVKVDTALNIQILFETVNGCGRFSRVDTATTGGTDFSIQYFVKYPVEGSDVVCADIAKPLVFNKPFRPALPGTYRFIVWKSESETLERVIEVVE